ncbi:MAG: YHS domain-containing protein [Candidatus Micrarchaeales archaeon]|jgi:Cu+-exporting ATPase|nr:YHS domain-containing protein [Candidatus Micrarchaeales archaeon]
MKDPVCGMEVKDAKFKSTYDGAGYEFCSSACKEKFDKDPKRYAKK